MPVNGLISMTNGQLFNRHPGPGFFGDSETANCGTLFPIRTQRVSTAESWGSGRVTAKGTLPRGNVPIAHAPQKAIDDAISNAQAPERG